MCRNDISNARIVMDNQQSTEKRATTVCELLATKLNNPDFAPETEVVEDLHADFSNPIHIPHSRVAALSSATPDKVQVTIKIVLGGMNEILQSFRRYEYDIISEHKEDVFLNNLKERSDYLDKYLSI